MSLISQSSSLHFDGSMYVLPGSLADVKALYFPGRGIVNGAVNCAPGGLQGAAFQGSPTFNSDGSATLTTNSIYLQTPIMETPELTIMGVVYSLSPVDGTALQVLWGSLGLDTTRSGNPNIGTVCRNALVSTAPAGQLTGLSYFGPNGGTAVAAQDGTTTGLAVPAWRTPNLIWQTSSTIAESFVTGNLTTGTSLASTAQTQPRQVNNVVPFRLGSTAVEPGTGTVNLVIWAYWIRVLAALERVAFQTWANGMLARKFSYTV